MPEVQSAATPTDILEASLSLIASTQERFDRLIQVQQAAQDRELKTLYDDRWKRRCARAWRITIDGMIITLFIDFLMWAIVNHLHYSVR